MVELKNFSSVDFEIKQGDRIAQLILLPVTLAEFMAMMGWATLAEGNPVSGLPMSSPATRGFSSTVVAGLKW